MRDRPHPNHKLEWPGGVVPEWARPQQNPNKRRGKGKSPGPPVPYEHDGSDAAGEGGRRQQREAGAGDDDDRRAKARARRDSEQIRVSQRVAENSLVGGTAASEHAPDERAEYDARQSYLPDDGDVDSRHR